MQIVAWTTLLCAGQNGFYLSCYGLAQLSHRERFQLPAASRRLLATLHISGDFAGYQVK